MIRKHFIISNHYAGIYDDADACFVHLRVEKVDANGWHMVAAGDPFSIILFMRKIKK